MQDGHVGDFIIAAAINVGLGLSIAAATRRHQRELKPRDGFLLVTLSWVLMSGSASLPFLIAMPDLSLTDAYFEAMSGLTTTGSTVLTGLDTLPPSINFRRHALHWFGGIGIIVLAVAILLLPGCSTTTTRTVITDKAGRVTDTTVVTKAADPAAYALAGAVVTAYAPPRARIIREEKAAATPGDVRRILRGPIRPREIARRWQPAVP
jgi:Trk-type K+ transport system membrane component